MRTLRVILMSVVTVAVSVCALAQPVTPTRQMKQWEPFMGKWVSQEEFRAKPDAPWEKGSSEWENRWLSGGFFVESPGSITLPDGQRLFVAQVYGYDPARKVHFTSFFASNGLLGTATWEWTGTTIKEEGTEVAPDGKASPYRCTWGLLPGNRAMESTCEYQTGGEWWVYRRTKGTKQ